ncbi:MAG TPA: hypothetical protein VG738_01885 [Chitinophagaceae bacterium]|nr:hypothetical protein [Chitinophagaceae bacterium]
MMAAINSSTMVLPGASPVAQTGDNTWKNTPLLTTLFAHDDVVKNAMHNMVKACGKISCTAMCKHRASTCRV